MKSATIGNRPVPLGVTCRMVTLAIWLSLFSAGLGTDAPANRRAPGFPPRKGGKGAEALMARHGRAGGDGSLPSEREVPWLSKLGRACDALPARTIRVNTRRDRYNVGIAVQQLGSPTDAPVLIFLHGVLADKGTWRYVAGALGKDHEIWLIDLPGCGASDAPHPNSIEPDGYSPAAMAERVLQALDQCFAGRGARRSILVGHSLGGTVCLRMFSDPDLRTRYKRVLDRIGGLVLLAPCDVALHAEIPIFVGIARLQGCSTAIGHALGLVEARVARATRKGFHVPEAATREQAQRLTRLLTRAKHRRAMQAMLRQALPWKIKQRRPNWPAVQQLASAYGNIDVSCLIVWGEWDEILPASMGHKLKDEIPGARLVRIEGSGHSLPGEAPVECAEIIREFAGLTQAGKFGLVPAVARYRGTRSYANLSDPGSPQPAAPDSRFAIAIPVERSVLAPPYFRQAR